MKDCDCEKNGIGDRWLDKNDFGDEFLREESFKIIHGIERDKKYYDINEDAVFNQKLEQNEINAMDIDDVEIDYSYLGENKFKGLKEKTPLKFLKEREEEASEEDYSEEIEPEWLKETKIDNIALKHVKQDSSEENEKIKPKRNKKKKKTKRKVNEISDEELDEILSD